MKRTLRLAATAGLTLLLLSSCVSIDTAIRVAKDGSGTVQLTYKVSRMVAEIGRVDKSWQGIPLPIEESDFRTAVSQVPGLTLNSFARSEDSNDITINAALAFANLNALNGLYSPGQAATGGGAAAGGQASTGGEGTAQPAISATTNGNATDYRQLLFEGFPDGVDDQSRQFADDFFKDYALTFDFTAPSDVKSANLGTISADKRTVHYSISIPKLLDQTKPLVWQIVW